jgi:uncharacterized protein YciI
MIYMIYCQDNLNQTEKRPPLRAQHLERLQALVDQERIIFAGPLFASDTQKQVVGSLIVAKFDSKQQAKHWIEEDIYYQKGIYQSVDIKAAKQVF